MATVPDLGCRHDPSVISLGRSTVSPWGDTVWRACQSLSDVFAGQVLTRCEFRVPVLAATDLTLRPSEVAAQLISLASSVGRESGKTAHGEVGVAVKRQ
jgi:hypothetical protein